MAFSVPDLPYDYAALEPHIDEQTMRIHHDKHHKAYVDNANAALAGTSLENTPVEEIVATLQVPEDKRTAVRNNAGGHLNHSLFWESMGPNGGGAPSGELASAIDAAFGSFDDFKAKLKDAGIKRFGSGWSWLVLGRIGARGHASTANQDNPLSDGRRHSSASTYGSTRTTCSTRTAGPTTSTPGGTRSTGARSPSVTPRAASTYIGFAACCSAKAPAGVDPSDMERSARAGMMARCACGWLVVIGRPAASENVRASPVPLVWTWWSWRSLRCRGRAGSGRRARLPPSSSATRWCASSRGGGAAAVGDGSSACAGAQLRVRGTPPDTRVWTRSRPLGLIVRRRASAGEPFGGLGLSGPAPSMNGGGSSSSDAHQRRRAAPHTTALTAAALGECDERVGGRLLPLEDAACALVAARPPVGDVPIAAEDLALLERQPAAQTQPRAAPAS